MRMVVSSIPMSSMRWLWLSLLWALLSASADAAPAASAFRYIQLGEAANYSVIINGQPWSTHTHQPINDRTHPFPTSPPPPSPLPSPPSPPPLRFVSGSTFFHVDGSLYSTADSTLRLTSIQNSSGSDAIGSYTSITFTYTTPTSPSPHTWQTSIREYPLTSTSYALIFSQSWLTSASNTSTGDKASILSSFPTFQPPPSTTSTPLGFLHYAGEFAYQTQLGRWSTTPPRPKLTSGLSGGPLLTFDHSGQWAAMVAASSEFMSTSIVDRGSEVGWGVIGSMLSVPAGYTMETMVYVDGGGINSCIEHWGDVMLRVYGKQRSTMWSEVSSTHLGFATDNGAYYYYNTEQGKDYQQTLLDVQAYWQSLGLPFPLRLVRLLVVLQIP